jgi:signal transduction histidine kinase
VDLGQTIDEAVGVLKLTPQARGVEICVVLPAVLPAIRGCPAHLYQMVLNLALNALDAMPSGGTLSLRVEEQDGNVVVSVADTGAGIAADVGRRVFEPFYTTKEPGRGTGLGLTVTYGIVQEHGGSIDYVSRPGVGTTFTVTIPTANGMKNDATSL